MKTKMASDAKRTKMGASRYRTKFNNAWTAEYPIKSVLNDIYKFYSVPCHKALSCDHQGKQDVTDHCASPSHKECVKSSKSQATLDMFCAHNTAQTSLEKKVVNTEVKITNFLVQYNLPVATADHLSYFFKEVFPDSNIAKNYTSRRTKTTSIINEAFAPHCREYLIQHCKTHPFSVGTDGPNNAGHEKMNPICLQIFDVNRSKKVTSHFLNMCLTSGKNASTAACIFDKINNKFTEYGLPWENCVRLSVNNTNAMIGRKNSVASRFKQKNESCFIGGCPCHFAHIAASNVNDAFSQHIGLNVEDVVVDLFYWFDESSKRKGN